MNSKRFDGIDHPVREVRDLREIILSSCEMFPQVDAYLYKDKTAGEFKGIKYSQVLKDMQALGTRFCDMGLKNKKIAVIGETSYYWFLAYYATVCGTGVIVPLDKNLPPEEVKNLVERSKANAIVYSKKMEKSIKSLFEEPCNVEFFISMDEEHHKGLAADGDPSNDQGRSGAAPNRILSMKALIEEGAHLVHQGDRTFIDAQIDPDEMASLLFTSGTTGKAKGVMLSHKNIASNVVNMSRREKLGDNYVVLSILPTHHTFENTCVDWTTFYQGKTLAICEGIKYISKNMNEVHANCMVGVPLVFEKIYKSMVKQAESSGQGEKLKNAIQLSRRLKLYNRPAVVKRMFKSVHEALGGEMEQFIAGGAAIDPQVILDFEAMGIPMMQGYGMTECSPIIAVNQNNYSIAESVGRPMHGTTVRIDNPDTDGVGEIVCRGPSVMLGYYEDPDATEEVLRDGWLYTGDLGYMDENGFLYVTGRKKTVIVTKGGKNIFPEEIEEVLKQNDLIKEVLVHGVTDKRIGNVAVTADIQPNFALLKERYGEMDSSQVYHFYKELVDKINGTMPSYKAIKRVNIREKDFEMTTTGKIKRYGNFVEGEEGAGSLDYREIKNEESKIAAEFLAEIRKSESPSVVNTDMEPVTDLRDVLKIAAEKREAAKLLSDVNGLGTALINMGAKGKTFRLPSLIGYQELVALLAVSCGLGKVEIVPAENAAGLLIDGEAIDIESLIEKGKQQLGLGDRQYIDSEVLGGDESITINDITFTHGNIAHGLMATAAAVECEKEPWEFKPINAEEFDITDLLINLFLPLYYGSPEKALSIYKVSGCAAPVAVIPIPSEGLSIRAFRERKMRKAVRKGALGHILPGLGIKFIDKDLSGNGEILLAGETLAPGEVTDGWLRTGDLGHFDDKEYLYVTGNVQDRFVGDGKGKEDE
ncbi:MAG: AMP-binding protein [Firmicutes bacterium]|nr:AMP-binding protein [Bacillota bacterium]